MCPCDPFPLRLRVAFLLTRCWMSLPWSESCHKAFNPPLPKANANSQPTPVTHIGLQPLTRGLQKTKESKCHLCLPEPCWAAPRTFLPVSPLCMCVIVGCTASLSLKTSITCLLSSPPPHVPGQPARPSWESRKLGFDCWRGRQWRQTQRRHPQI